MFCSSLIFCSIFGWGSVLCHLASWVLSGSGSSKVLKESVKVYEKVSFLKLQLAKRIFIWLEKKYYAFFSFFLDYQRRYISDEKQKQKILPENSFYLGFLSRTFTIYRRVREEGGYLFNSSIPFPPVSQTLRN